ncbi:unnamed protein product [Paramecium sonneborni]|uniref:Rab-GAP TBC domain-containing protein n=1 Tax=Paramecium sonneborni TaxID=65129 RepID=A0A8S1LI96_9CILI|nr:unnamed protein product [Paramecium sonneborni]
MKNNKHFIQTKLNLNLSKEYIKTIKGYLNSKQSINNKLNIEQLHMFYKTFNNADHSEKNQKINLIHTEYNFDQFFAKIIKNKETNPNYYTKFLKMKESSKYFQDTKQKDLVRTLSNEEMQQILSNFITAYVIRNAQIGYCQEFNYIVYYLLLKQQYSEEVLIKLKQQFLQIEKPHQIEHLKNTSVETSLLTIQWLVFYFKQILVQYNNKSQLI